MTVKRFTETLSTGIVTDHVTGKEYKCEMRIDDKLLELLNELHEENQELKQLIHTMLMQIDVENIGDENARYSARIVFDKKDFKLLMVMWNDYEKI